MGQLCCFPFARDEGKICKYNLRLAEALVLAYNVEVALALGFPPGESAGKRAVVLNCVFNAGVNYSDRLTLEAHF